MASYYLLEFDCDNSIDIVEASKVIFDGENDTAEVGAKVTAEYRFGKKRNMYEAKVVNRSEFSNEVSKKRGWVVVHEKQLVAAMNTKLSELRAAAKKNK